MKYLEQKPGHLWWTRNPKTFLYFLREISAFLILISIIGTIAIVFNFIGVPARTDRTPIIIPFLYIGFAGALIHSVTWLAAMPQILPFKLNKSQQIVAYIILLAILLGITLLFNFITFHKLVILI
jgi:fumarate reductase subunit C